MRTVTINDFIQEFTKDNPDIKDAIIAVVKRLFDTTFQVDAPFEEYVIYKAYLAYYQTNGNKSNSAILDVSIDFKKSERAVRYVVEKYSHLNKRKRA